MSALRAARRQFRRLLPALQASECNSCRAIMLERRRRPCWRCGSLSRFHRRELVYTFGATDWMG